MNEEKLKVLEMLNEGKLLPIHGGLTLLGITVGALIGFVSGGGVSAFLYTGWINTLIGTAVGGMFGGGVELISNSMILIN